MIQEYNLSYSRNVIEHQHINKTVLLTVKSGHNNNILIKVEEVVEKSPNHNFFILVTI